MRKIHYVTLLLLFSLPALASNKIETLFKKHAERIKIINLDTLPVKNRGRLKPLDSMARESSLYLTGKYSMYGLSPAQFLIALSSFPQIGELPIINVRTLELREKLGFLKDKRYFTLNELEQTDLQSRAMKAMRLEQKNKNLLSPLQNGIIEVFNQMWVLKQIASGDHLINSLKYDDQSSEDPYSTVAAKNLLRSLDGSQDNSVIIHWTNELKKSALETPMPENLKGQLDKMQMEVSYHKFHLFMLAGIFSILIGLATFLPFSKKIVQHKSFSFIQLIPLILVVVGFVFRVLITEFPPVTNMYGTMLWVAFGICLFSSIFYLLYKDLKILGIMSLGAGLLLILTENIPLIISPNMDPIVAVLRNSFWLTTHVLSITISYAAFSMAMLFSNYVIINTLAKGYNKTMVKTFSHYIYRSIQLGVFLITAGIILGGVWADYSWGRFWGWDPKETWALIADLGFLILLHGRYTGWINNFRLVLLAPVAYLLVIMAWFGVNFILAAGLHSYGFSTGGSAMVVTFTLVQIGLLIAYFVKVSVLDAKK